MFQTIDALELSRLIQSGEAPRMVDVRTAAEVVPRDDRRRDAHRAVDVAGATLRARQRRACCRVLPVGCAVGASLRLPRRARLSPRVQSGWRHRRLGAGRPATEWTGSIMDQTAQFEREVDARGLNCPLPILRTKKALNDMSERAGPAHPGDRSVIGSRLRGVRPADRQSAAAAKRAEWRIRFPAPTQVAAGANARSDDAFPLR